MEVDYNKFIVEPENPVKYAFTSGGVDFFEFENINMTPILRKEAAEDIRLQEERRVDNAYIQSFIDSIKDCLNQGNIVQAVTAVNNLEERVKYITNLNLRYQYLSVVYFDYKENPNSYDDEHASWKIKHWRKHDDVHSFFLKTRIASLAFFYHTTMQDFLKYTRMELRQIEKHYRHHLLTLSKGKEETDSPLPIQLQLEILREWQQYAK